MIIRVATKLDVPQMLQWPSMYIEKFNTCCWDTKICRCNKKYFTNKII